MKNKNKGFTLVELVISLAIIAIVVSLSSTVAVVISKASYQREFENECITEYESANSLIMEFNNIYSTYQYTLTLVEEDVIKIEDASNEYLLGFDTATKTLSAQILNYETMEVDTKTITFKNISNIQFSNGTSEKIVKCVYVIDGFRNYTNLISFGVNWWL